MPFPDRPRVSRETRLLLATVFLSLAALWVLARIRFPEQPRTPNPVAPLLTQLVPMPGTAFEDLERAVFELEPRVAPALTMISVHRPSLAVRTGDETQLIPSLRFRDDAVLALIDKPTGASITGGTLVAHDPLTGLSVLRTSSSELPQIQTWTPQRFGYPRYVLVSDMSQGSFTLRPVFVGHLNSTPNSLWSSDVWRISSYAAVPDGAFVFTTGGALAGLAIRQRDGSAIVPADTLISLAQRLLEEAQKPPGRLGIDVQPLTPQIRSATGLTSGVVVTWVDPQGPSAGKIVATDIIDHAGRHTTQTVADWETITAAMTAGEGVLLRIWRNGGTEYVQLTALPPQIQASSRRLGLTMRSKASMGAEVLAVEEGSVAMRAGIAVDDVLTRIGDVASPTPAQVTSAFAESANDRALLVAITRGTEHFVVGLVRR